MGFFQIDEYSGIEVICDVTFTVKNISVEFPELPIFSVIFTGRLVRGFSTYRTLLEIM